MSTLDERSAYEKNPYFTGHIYGNFSPFYVTIAICTVILGTIIILNIVLGCCSKHRHYWQDKHTGNRWLVSIWSVTPHLQPPLDLKELEESAAFKNIQQAPTIYNENIEHKELGIQQSQKISSIFEKSGINTRREYLELQKRESDI